MQLHFSTSQAVPSFHNHNTPPQLSTFDSYFRVFAIEIIETTFFPARHEAVFLVEISTQRFLETSAGIVEPTSAFCRKHQLLSFSSLCEFEKFVRTRLVYPVTNDTVHKGSTRGTVSVVNSEDVIEIYIVLTNHPELSNGSIFDKYDINELLIQSELSLIPKLTPSLHSFTGSNQMSSQTPNGILLGAILCNIKQTSIPGRNP